MEWPSIAPGMRLFYTSVAMFITCGYMLFFSKYKSYWREQDESIIYWIGFALVSVIVLWGVIVLLISWIIHLIN